MSTITEKTVREIAVQRPQSIRVFERFGIDYCCGGAKPLEEVCAKARVRVDDVLAAIQAMELKIDADDLYDWSVSSLEKLIKHIETTHHEYVRCEVPRLLAILDKVEQVHGANHPEVGEARSYFQELAPELSAHMMKEEEVLFPYVIRMERAVNEGKAAPMAFFGSVRNPIGSMVHEHETAGGLLAEIRRACKDFRVPDDVCTTYRAMYQGLEEFEQDLHRHVHLENNILFPRTQQMEIEHRPKE